jgi:hypothetical protein
MPIIDLCSASGTGNTGSINCDPKRGDFLKLIVGGPAFTPSQYQTSAAFKTALLAALNKGVGETGKAFPFAEVTTVTENTAANQTATLGNGTQVPLSEGRPSYDIGQYIGVNQEKALRKFNNQKLPVFILDSNGRVWGKLDSANNFVGVQATLFTKGAGFGDFKSAKEVVTSLAFTSASDFFDYSAFVQTDFAASDLEGLIDVEFSKAAASSGNVHHIVGTWKSTQLGADENMYAIYKTLLTSISLWIGITPAGARVHPTAVAFNDTNQGWDLTFGVSVNAVNFDYPSVLTAAGVTGVEGVLFSVV